MEDQIFHNEQGNIVIFEYVWDRPKDNWSCKNRNKIGVLCGFKNPETFAVNIGWSKYATNLEDAKFDDNYGKYIAIGRAGKGRNIDIEKLPFALRKQMKKFVERCKKYFKVAHINNINKNESVPVNSGTYVFHCREDVRPCFWYDETITFK